MNPNALQVNVRMGPATRQKLDALKEQYGSRSQVVAVAVDRLYQSEWARSNGELEWRKPYAVSLQEPDNA